MAKKPPTMVKLTSDTRRCFSALCVNLLSFKSLYVLRQIQMLRWNCCLIEPSKIPG